MLEGITSSMEHDKSVKPGKGDMTLHKQAFLKIAVALHHKTDFVPEPANDVFCASCGYPFVRALSYKNLHSVTIDQPTGEDLAHNKDFQITEHRKRQLGQQVKVSVLSEPL